MNPCETTSKQRSNAGFALIASISIMAVLVLIGVTLYSLSAVATKSAEIAKARTEAQANAKMALMQAIGNLQAELGPDQRISANAAIFDTDRTSPEIKGLEHPHWTGVWDSWVAGDPRNAQVNPDYPGLNNSDTYSHHQTIGDQPEESMHPDYDEKDSHFRRWLVSLLESDLDPDDPLRPAARPLAGQRQPGFYNPNNPAAVQLVGEVSLGGDLDNPSKADEYVSARLVPIKEDDTTTASGRYGWWVGDESQKAMIRGNSYEESDPDSLAEKLFRQQAPASLGNSEIPGLENVADQSDLFSIPSRDSMALISGATDELTEQFHHVTTKSLGVLADVREGGLKRDLSTLLERTIDPEEVYNLSSEGDFERAASLTADGEDFMLYNFDDLLNSSVGETGEAAVPIQDLAAYYQLYNRYRPDSRGGIQYSSSESSPPNDLLNNGIMVSNPDYGRTQSDLDLYLRQYTSLYRRPVPVKVEMMLCYTAEPRPRDEIQAEIDDGIEEPDRYNLRLGIMPAVTFWNPNNVPLVMNIDDPDQDSLMMREIPIPLRFSFQKGETREGPFEDDNDWVRQMGQVTSTQQGELYTFFVSGNYPVVFEPGESKVLSLRYASATDADTGNIDVDFMLRGRGNNRYSEAFVDELEIVPGWNQDRFIRARTDGGSRKDPIIMTFDTDDFITVSIEPGQNGGVGIERYSFGNAFTQKSRHGRNSPGVKWNFKTFNIQARFNNGGDSTFTDGVVYRGFPLTGSGSLVDLTQRTIELPAISGQTIIDSIGNPFTPRDDLPLPFFYYGIKASTETHESNNVTGPAEGAGRRFVTRPFTHSTPIAPAFIDQTDPTSLYNIPWNWFFLPLDGIADAPVEISAGNSGYYGGGFTAESGVTHVVQQQLPVTPPLSIATLSHAHLGGFSLGTEPARSGNEDYSRTTALGHGGLAPHTLQAIGNSYAHPNIPAERAWTIWTRQFEGNNRVDEPFADHSYLANKALWDDYFFSSISPKPGDSAAFAEDRTAEEVATDFFFDDQPLPNPRIVPYPNDFEESDLDDLFDDYDLFGDGFGDKIAAELMVEGPFNINSTSILAWRALFSSLKGQDVSYLDARSALVVGTNLDFDSIDGVPLTGGPLPSGQGYEDSSSSPSDRPQWTGFRELTDTEIDELALAMVEQVKLRGPFLSLSEFINRRLDPGNTDDMALKGALQAAIDAEDVSINDGFRGNNDREFTSEEKSFMGTTAFDDALDGAIAYGSNAYIDQADLLKNFPAQLTARGDTFVVRAYGDTLDQNGQVQARAWCEAVVQRIPDYVDPTSDEPHIKQAALVSEANKTFGRQFKIISFRWLDSSEI